MAFQSICTVDTRGKVKHNFICLDHGDKIVRKTLVKGAIPSLNMGRILHNTTLSKNRVERTIVNVNENLDNEKVSYNSLEELRKKIKGLKTLQKWTVDISDPEKVVLMFWSPMYNSCIPYLKITIDSGLGFTIQVFNWYLPEDIELLTVNKRSLRNTTVVNLVKACLKLKLCLGMDSKESGTKFIHHFIPNSLNTHSQMDEGKALRVNNFPTR